MLHREEFFMKTDYRSLKNDPFSGKSKTAPLNSSIDKIFKELLSIAVREHYSFEQAHLKQDVDLLLF
jgi:hypothetical protein